VPAPVVTLALYQRFASRDQNSYANRLVAALRNQFGGHAVRTEPVAGPATGASGAAETVGGRTSS
jgi:6-phosphogluconate dehydrogenase